MPPTASHPLAEREVYSDAARATIASLERRLARLLSDVHETEVWKTVMAPDTPLPLLIATLREVMWAVAQYQGHTTAAGFTMLGRLPKADSRLLTSLVHHKAEEAEHGEWARRDYLLLGGDRIQRASDLSPATFAVAAVWDRLASAEDALGYLGAEYLFECLTMEITREVVPVLIARNAPLASVGFITEHAVEDVKHTNLIVHWILDVVTRYPESGAAMERCFDNFAHVYPVPVWNEALERAKAI